MMALRSMFVAEFSMPRSIYGISLDKHLANTNRSISSVIEDCVVALLKYGLHEEVSRMIMMTVFYHISNVLKLV